MSKTKNDILSRSFYLRPTLSVAQDLIGKILCFKNKNGTLAGRIVEVEAYLGHDDAASHSWRGMTRRCDAMFLEGGHAYVYFTYGVHYCFNVVTQNAGEGHAVLIRSLEPLKGLDCMIANRGTDALANLCSGPGKLCQALGISKNENKLDLCDSNLLLREGPAAKKIIAAPRIGITRNTDKHWRFYDSESEHISRKIKKNSVVKFKQPNPD